MAPFPLSLVTLFGKTGEFIVYFLIGFGFGYVLEISGFGNSKKLAAQFYFKELTVLKVMFSAIIVAMVLIFAASGLGLLDYNLIWVNPTYLWPGIVGGLIMGVGFIIGGFCPGTSLVSAATFKVDGIFFSLGTLFGIFLFGETVENFELFWNSSYLGRLTIQDWLGVDAGWVVLGVVLMALFMFWGSEQLERIVGKRDLAKEPRLRYAGAGGLVLLAGAVLLIGQPTTADRWAHIQTEKELALAERAVQVHPGELLATMHDHKVNLVLLDVRPEAEYNLFHLANARRVEQAELPALSKQLQTEPANSVFILMSNDETDATQAWKTLAAESVPNIYILEGGLNNWLAYFAGADPQIRPLADLDIDLQSNTSKTAPAEQLRYAFPAALGAAYHAARPEPGEYQLEYTPKIELKNKKGGGGGGCG
jgi:rhodanese-related sulfurtransferase